MVTLALYWPTSAELAAGALDGPARFDLVTRYGWLSSPEGRAVRRKEVRMVSEGSLLNPDAVPRGALADTTPDGFTAYRVYRYGLAFSIGARLRELAHG